MIWFRVDADEHLAPWVLQVGNEAYGCYLRLAGYCARHLTDGHVPRQVARVILGGLDPDALDALVDAGRVEIDDDGTVRLPHYLDLNQSREQVEAKKAANAERVAKHRRKKRGNLHAV
jgi:hypothetical protein